MSDDYGAARLHGYKPIREYREIRCVICGEEVDPEELDDPEAMVSDPSGVHWGCMP